VKRIVLGRTELGLLIRPDDSPVPLLDTTRPDGARAIELALRTKEH
jgi:aspartate/glutamate racemase